MKKFRLVKKTWDSEAVTSMRDFLLCDARISGQSHCANLLDLAQVVSGMNVGPIKSLSSIDLGGSTHSECKMIENQANMLENLLERLYLKYLYISWETTFKPLDCPAVNFVVEVLGRKIMMLSALEFDQLPDKFLTHFGNVWAPWLPKLEYLDTGDLYLCRWASQSEFVMKILKGAPNLKKFTGNDLDSRILEVIPEQKYFLLNNIWLTID